MTTIFSLEGYEPSEGRALLVADWGTRAKRKLAALAEFEAGCDASVNDMIERSRRNSEK